MGLSYVEMHYLVFQKEALRLNECRRVLDIGLQEVQAFGHSEFVHNFIQAFSPDTNVASQDLDHLNTHCFLYDIFEYIDAEYVCYEVDGKRPYTFFDLNFDTVSDEHRGKFDLVLNFGTSEHVMNQYNFYKTVHDACAVGGHMIHSIPFSGLTNHGFFNTNPKFLINLAGLNGYELLDMNMTITREPSGIDEYILNYLNQDSDFLAYANQTGLSRVKDNFKATDSQLRVTLKKNKRHGIRPCRRCGIPQQISLRHPFGKDDITRFQFAEIAGCPRR